MTLPKFPMGKERKISMLPADEFVDEAADNDVEKEEEVEAIDANAGAEYEPVDAVNK